MRPERTAGLVRRWVQFYTRDLAAPAARRRVEEIDADLHDHIAHERASGTADRRIALAVASRMLRGLAADASWRAGQAKASAQHSTREKTLKGYTPIFRSAARVAFGVALVLSLLLVGMLVSGDVTWSAADFVAAGVFLAAIGTTIELAVRRVGNLALAIAVGTLGVAAAVFGEADDAPGLVLLGLVLVASACALGVRKARARHSG